MEGLTMQEQGRDVPQAAAAKPRRRRQLGEMLVAQRVITAEQLAQALARQRGEPGTRVGRLLVEMGFATDVQICEAIAEQLQIPAADLVAVDIPTEVLNRVPKDLAIKYGCLPWFVEGRDLYLIMADPTNIVAADALAFAAGLRVRPVVAPELEVVAAIQRFYAAEETSLAQLEGLDVAEQLSVVAEGDSELMAEDDSIEAAQAAPVVKLVNAMLVDAVRGGASDIHVEPQQRDVSLRYRVDGMLRQVMRMPLRVHNKVVSRIKIMAHMDISERRRPLDGRARLLVGPKPYDLRVSTLPTADGEKVVIRILAQDRAQVSLDDLGFEPDVLDTFRGLLRRPQGMILVTGPTGSGKTSTLYAALNFIKSETVNIVTIEDPVEYRLAGISQVAVSEKAGLTFAAGLRSILRQDPDVVMVGEIRDAETAEVAFQAAQTGHLVLSTLHTNDAPSAATRLVELGVPAYVVTSSAIAIMAQRLVRRLCDCKTVAADGHAAIRGCQACRFTGYRGRMALYELLRFTPRVRSVLLGQGTEDDVRRAGLASGMVTLHGDGERKVARGLTTPDEVQRVAPPDEEIEPQGQPTEPAASTRTRPAPLAAEAQRARPARILVVEDDASYRGVLRDTLASEHYEVVAVGDGEEALARIYRDAPDLILTDLHMPGLDGLELLHRLRSDLSMSRIPVLFLTVIDSTASETAALDQGADDYLTKPVDRALLLSHIRRALFRSQLASI
jgi:type IV pilus assembly protein PilB